MNPPHFFILILAELLSVISVLGCFLKQLMVYLNHIEECMFVMYFCFCVFVSFSLIRAPLRLD